ncbi:insulinase family protein [Desertifilum sp. FACHB-1129]|uniref:Peptidase M16 n=1 Tax=Desertifilum tharense IPPAS B-1220 TaxID=1781255 RepID=A0A1E5QGP9_9CYAN|nr:MULTISPECIES: pitrilysin family protein [Desertifilum]MDA0209623.1 pitrilysin family protein [Cyanobacteria bacterium FC1]MBD2313033.1 insulinase family protein [Desertifilum sp. FACHB-1129]MBD2320921.1 insulinase family protein [Desertifilum sp. FACHB-866]MBD2331050.1 insulinase family protein [Desertifilum sp. FACHB-868]OEJ73866.1 peptidase M16 [Desertifilum tharense IPPAS B-1220]
MRFFSQRSFVWLGLLFSMSLMATCLFGSPNRTQAAPLPGECIPPQDASSLSITQDVCHVVLNNGLTVLTKEVHKAPVVTVQVWYRVGSRYEPPGFNGISHQLEHMLFKGTTHRPLQWGRLFNALGSESNAFTSYEHTVYFNTAERSKLQTLLTLEADRMQNTAIAPADLQSEKRVVLSELAGYENRIGYRLSRAMMQAAFPNHPYGQAVGGTKSDIENLTVAQLQNYYQTYYHPNNATLVIVGDIDTASTLRAIQDTFGQIPRGEVPPAPLPPALPSRRSIAPVVLQEPGSTEHLQLLYPLPAIRESGRNFPRERFANRDIPALQVLDYLFSKGRSSRLYQSLVETGLASEVSGSANHLTHQGWYRLQAILTADRSAREGIEAIDRAIAKLQTQGVTPQELARAKAQLQAQNLLRNRDITRLAMQLGDDQTTAGDYTWSDRYLAAVNQVSAADIQRVAQTYLQPSARTVGFLQPTGLPSTAIESASAYAAPENFNLATGAQWSEVQQYLPPFTPPAQEPQPTLPQTFTLANGLQVLLIQDSSTPTITLSGYLQAGSQFDPERQAGLARLTAENLMNGTHRQSALTLANRLEDRGARLQFQTNREGVLVEAQALSSDLETLIQTLADVLQHPSFPVEQFERSRQRALQALERDLESPSHLAQRTLQQAIYPVNHPFHPFPTRDTLQSVEHQDLASFHRTHYRPDTMAIAIVGDTTPQELQRLMVRYFGRWSGEGSPRQLQFPPVNLPESSIALNSVLPGRKQSIIYMGYKGIGRQDPRYYAALVLNQILGGDTLSSRLGTQVRDRLGLTYGIYSYFQTGLNPGPFVIEMQTAPQDTQSAIATTLTLLDQLQRQGVTLQEVQVAQNAIASRYPVSLKDPDYLAAQVLFNHVYGLPPSELRIFPHKISNVTLEAVNQAAKELLHPGHLVVVTAGPPTEEANSL